MEQCLVENRELGMESNGAKNEKANTISNGLLSLYNPDKGNFVSDYVALYKATKTCISQEERREILLQEIKQRRNEAVDQKRGISELFNDDEGSDDFVEEEPMLVDAKSPHRKRKKTMFRNQLMLSEWFTEIPSDLDTNWLVKLCPVGVRNLVVARNKITKAYNRAGKLQAEFYSELPGGGPQSFRVAAFTVVDCIYNARTRTYFVLDVLAWNSQSVRYCSTDFRFYWLKSKLDESPLLKSISMLNDYCFSEIESYPAELSVIQDSLSHPHWMDDKLIPIDGLLFYHRETHYVKMWTPLVGWLKPYMVADMLHVPVDEYFMRKKPEDYVSLPQYLASRQKQPKEKATCKEVDECSTAMET